MSAPDQILDALQADIVAVLKNTPSLAHAYVFTGSEKDLATRLHKTFGTRTNSAGGKRGLGIQVLPIFVTEAESNLPGPPLKLRCQIMALENVTLNRAPATGTLQTTSQASLNVLAALHLRGFGTHVTYAEKSPITPEKVDAGFEAHVVTVYTRSSGIEPPAKTAGVSAAWQAGAMLVTGSSSPGAGGLLLPAGTEAGRPKYTSTGLPYQEALEDSWPFIFVHWDPDELKWYLTRLIDNSGLFASSTVWASASDVATPDLATGWTPQSPATGTPVITPVDALTLATATSGAAIHYSTDGTYPAPDTGTLYAAPLTGLTAGTILRAVAYAAALNPSDLTELQITG